MDADAVLRELRSLADPTRLPGMARYGIVVDRALGVSIPDLRRLARRLGQDHELALALWATRVHEARILAAMVDDPARVTRTQMDRWARDLDSWDVCDQVCSNLFDATPFALEKALAWSSQRPEFVKRAAFATVAAAAVHRKDEDDARFAAFFPAIEAQATDDRPYVRKAVNWALRQIGKRSPELHRGAISCAERIRERDSRSARWIASDALRELRSEAVRGRLGLGAAQA